MELQLSPDRRYLYITKATEHEYEQLKLSFTKRIDNWRFHPLVKRGVWSGDVCFVKGNKLPSGLWMEVMEVFKEHNLPLKLIDTIKLFNIDIEKEEFYKWVDKFFEGNEKKPRDYQVDTAYKILRYRRCLAELATSAGKSLIVFMVIAYLLEYDVAEKILLIVPNVSLVLQATEDFNDYNTDEKVTLKIQQIFSGMKLKENTNLVIGTYQSLVKKDEEYFKQFNIVIIDETHKANSSSICKILDRCWHCDYRFGVSGTIPKPQTIDRYNLMSNTGPLITNISADYLINKGFISPCEVKMIYMDYVSDEQKEAFLWLSKSSNEDERKKVFKLEQDYVAESNKRLKFIANVIKKSTKNSLILFHRIEHGKKLYDLLRNIYEGDVYYVDGGTDKDLREDYKKLMEVGDKRLLVASFGTFSTGINITNIHNVFFTESFKSEIIIRQSIGRGLRLHNRKDKLIIIDFVDDMRYKLENGKTFVNYLFKHAEARKEIYKEQKFSYTMQNIKF